MKLKMHIFATIGVIAVLAMGATYTTVTSESNPAPAKPIEMITLNAPGTWQTILMKDGGKCEGLVFQSSDDASKAASKIGCSGYHEHPQEDGSVVYMPCRDELARDKVNVEEIRTEIQKALANGEITQSQADEKVAWLAAKNLD